MRVSLIATMLLVGCSGKSEPAQVDGGPPPAPIDSTGSAEVPPVDGEVAEDAGVVQMDTVLTAVLAQVESREDGYWIRMRQVSSVLDGLPSSLESSIPGISQRIGFVSCDEVPGEAEIFLDLVVLHPEDGTVSIRFDFRSGALLESMTGVRVRIP